MAIFQFITPLWNASQRWLSRTFRRSGIALALIAGLAQPAMRLAPVTALEFPPTRKGAPVRTSGGGSREGSKVLTAILPTDDVHTFTGNEAKLLINLPESLNKSAVLLIMDGDDELFYSEFELPEINGLVGIQLPESVTSQMELGKYYDWEFAVLPDGEIQKEEQVVSGVIQKVEPPELSAQSNPINEAESYAQAGIWQHTVFAIAPKQVEFEAPWMSLLESIKLEDIKTRPWLGVLEVDS